jgi:transposase
MDATPTATTDFAEDARTIDRKDVRTPRIEVITRGERRRIWTLEQKREIVAESLGSTLTPAEVARKYAISSGLLYGWRRKMLGGQMTLLSCLPPSFAQVEVTPAAVPPDAPQPNPAEAVPPSGAAVSARPAGLIEIMLPDDVTLRVDAQVDGKALRRVLAALAER